MTFILKKKYIYINIRGERLTISALPLALKKMKINTLRKYAFDLESINVKVLTSPKYLQLLNRMLISAGDLLCKG